jgi:hypothetical protein
MKREINPKMFSWLDFRLKNFGLAQEAIKNKDARKVFIYAVESCVGIKEEGSDNCGPLVELLQDTIGNAGKEAWCLSMIQTCLAYAEQRTGKKSPLPATEHCLTMWRDAPRDLIVKIQPKRGAIAVWNYVGTSNGHCGMFEEMTSATTFRSIEANTSDKNDGKIERNGDVVCYKERQLKTGGNFLLLGFIRPFSRS